MGVWGRGDRRCCLAPPKLRAGCTQPVPLLTTLSLGPTVRWLHLAISPADPVPAPGPGTPLVVLAPLCTVVSDTASLTLGLLATQSKE